MNKIQVDGMAAVLGVTFYPARPHVTDKICYNNHRDYHCGNKATEEAVKRVGPDVVSIRTCSNAYCRISAAIEAHALSLPLTKAQREAVEDTAAQHAIRLRANRSIALLEDQMFRKFGRRISLMPSPGLS